MRKRGSRSFLICAFLAFSGCALDLTRDEPLSDYFDWFGYFVTIRRDSIRVQINNNSENVPPTLDYCIGSLKGKLVSGRSLVVKIPIQDSLTATWYNSEEDSLKVPLFVNKSVFDSMPYERDSIVRVFHPGDTPTKYMAIIDWSQFKISNGKGYWVSCSDSAAKQLRDSVVLGVSESSVFTAPPRCHLGRVRLFQQPYDTLNYAIVHRLYEIHFKSSGIDDL